MSAIKIIKKYARLMGLEKNQIGYVMLSNMAKEIADDIKESRPTVRAKRPVQQAKVKIRPCNRYDINGCSARNNGKCTLPKCCWERPNI